MRAAPITRAMLFMVPIGLLAFSLCAAAQAPAAAKRVAHVSNSFSFTVPASLHDAAPLFGPEGERAWAGTEWNPQFLFPSPAKDIEGAVFTVQHGTHRSVWVNTRFDLEAGRMQYVAVLPDLLVSTIDVALHPIDAAHTRVDVNYVRTALRPETNEHVIAMGRHDRAQGPDWEQSIRRYLAGQRRVIR
jgi:hypothetical protein